MIKTCVFLGQEPNLAPEILSDKIDCQKPGAERSVRELGIPNLDKSSQAEQTPSASTKNEKGAFPCKRGIFKSTEGHFLEISSTKIVKTRVFRDRSNFLKNVVFRCRYFMGQSQIIRGTKNCTSRIMSFTMAGMTFWSVKVLEHHDLRKMEAN